jgi:hypothetical protein
MRVPVLARRPPTLLEQLLGRRRARSFRRRLGVLCLGAGASLLRPRVPVAQLVGLLVASTAAVVLLLV